MVPLYERRAHDQLTRQAWETARALGLDPRMEMPLTLGTRRDDVIIDLLLTKPAALPIEVKTGLWQFDAFRRALFQTCAYRVAVDADEAWLLADYDPGERGHVIAARLGVRCVTPTDFETMLRRWMMRAALMDRAEREAS